MDARVALEEELDGECVCLVLGEARCLASGLLTSARGVVPDAWRCSAPERSAVVRRAQRPLQGFLAQKRPPPPQDLTEAYAQGHMVVPWGGCLV